MFVPAPNKMYYCVLTNVVLVYILFGLWLCPLQDITKLRLENSRQKIFTYKKQPTKFDIFSDRYFEP